MQKKWEIYLNISSKENNSFLIIEDMYFCGPFVLEKYVNMLG